MLWTGNLSKWLLEMGTVEIQAGMGDERRKTLYFIVFPCISDCDPPIKGVRLWLLIKLKLLEINKRWWAIFIGLKTNKSLHTVKV